MSDMSLPRACAGKVEGAYDEEMEYGAGLQQSLQRFESRDKRMKTANLEERAKRQVCMCACVQVCMGMGV